jgi:hypothetical protein
MNKKIEVLSREVRLTGVNDQDYVCLTDIARYKNPEASDDLIRNWLRNRNTIEFLGIWEQINNPGFNPVEFDGIKKEDLLNMALFGQTATEWRAANTGEKGNIRDQATSAQLVCLSNLENLNALFIRQGLSQPDRLTKLNQIAIHQMKLLTAENRLPELPEGRKRY